MMDEQLAAAYQALTQRAGVVRLDRAQVAMSGKDRATMLHKFCTQDVLGKQPGQGGEAFICNVQGKIVGYVYFLVGEQEIVLDTAAGQAQTLINHLDRYVITEDVQFADRSRELATLVLAGPQATLLLPDAPAEMYSHKKLEIDGVTVECRHVPFAGGSYFLAIPSADAERVQNALIARGATLCSPAAIECLRIETATPLYGIDITTENLPQEISRDAFAINFRKGCYLGQETVARIDALGHVNKHLVQVQFAADADIATGKELFVGDKAIGRVTSVCWSPKVQAPLALAYVRREHCAVGTKLTEGEVVALTPPSP
jgi:folate-binding protein YgfZ